VDFKELIWFGEGGAAGRREASSLQAAARGDDGRGLLVSFHGILEGCRRSTHVASGPGRGDRGGDEQGVFRYAVDFVVLLSDAALPPLVVTVGECGGGRGDNGRG
jgi:hypothetical protein